MRQKDGEMLTTGLAVDRNKMSQSGSKKGRLKVPVCALWVSHAKNKSAEMSCVAERE